MKRKLSEGYRLAIENFHRRRREYPPDRLVFDDALLDYAILKGHDTLAWWIEERREYMMRNPHVSEDWARYVKIAPLRTPLHSPGEECTLEKYIDHYRSMLLREPLSFWAKLFPRIAQNPCCEQSFLLHEHIEMGLLIEYLDSRDSVTLACPSLVGRAPAHLVEKVKLILTHPRVILKNIWWEWILNNWRVWRDVVPYFTQEMVEHSPPVDLLDLSERLMRDGIFIPSWVVPFVKVHPEKFLPLFMSRLPCTELGQCDLWIYRSGWGTMRRLFEIAGKKECVKMLSPLARSLMYPWINFRQGLSEESRPYREYSFRLCVIRLLCGGFPERELPEGVKNHLPRQIELILREMI